jgi:dienelactone hydrolase
MERIFLTTKDKVRIAADYQNVDTSQYQQPKGWLVLVHMMPATKESFDSLAKEFQKIGYESIAIDLRGHGESTNADLRGLNADSSGLDADLSRQKLDYRNFSNEEHQKSILDLEAAVEYLATSRRATSDKIIFIGASIGANLALQYIAKNPEFKTAILLSPGLNYRGIETEPLVKKLQAGQKVFFISAKDDGNNAKQNQKLFDLTPAGIEKKIKIYQTGGHGTDILENQPELINLIIDFIRMAAV